VGSKGAGRQLTPEVAAKRLCMGVADLPDLGKPWTGRDVAEMQRSRAEWLRSARATRAEEDRLRKARRRDAVLAGRLGFEYPAITAAATDFAQDFAGTNLLAFLYDALDVAAAETYVVDCGFDVSTHARRVDETNRERAKRGVSLSGRNEHWCHDHGFYREPGTLGDLLDAPTGNTRATHVSGAGLDAETFDDAWYDRWALEGLAHAHVIAELVMRGDVATLETIAADRRAGLRKALGECMKPGVDRLLVEHPDRLARFGVGVIEHLLTGYGVAVVYTGQAVDESAESELVRDMLAIVTSFAGRLYGQRSAKTKRLRAAVSAETECGDAA
jgi:hypothetical protein